MSLAGRLAGLAAKDVIEARTMLRELIADNDAQREAGTRVSRVVIIHTDTARLILEELRSIARKGEIMERANE